MKRLPRKKKKQLKKEYSVAWRTGYSIQKMAVELHHTMKKLERRIWFSYESQRQDDECFFKGFQNINL